MPRGDYHTKIWLGVHFTTFRTSRKWKTRVIELPFIYFGIVSYKRYRD